MTRAGASRSRSIRGSPRSARGGRQTLVGHVTGRHARTWVYDKKRHGGFYTQDDIREIVAYARERFVRVVPEIEMPGHSQAAIAAYPSLGNFGDTVTVWGAWGVSPYILNPSDTTIAFMQDVLTEVMALFPGDFIHIGGDEAIKPQWKASPRAQARMQRSSASRPRTSCRAGSSPRWTRSSPSQGPAPGRLGRDPRGRTRAERRRDVVARHRRRSRRGARRPRRRDDAGQPHLLRSLSISKHADSSRWRSAASCRSIRRTPTSPFPPTSSRSSSSTSSARRGRSGPSTSKDRRTSSTWRSRASPRSPKCCGRRRN